MTEPRADIGATEALAASLAETSYEDFSSEVVQHTKRIVLDFLGVALAGSLMENSTILAGTAAGWGGKPEATVIGFPFKLPAPAAGLVNGAIGHAVQMDDTEWATVAHLGTEIIPAALAVAESQGGAQGREIIRAVVLGYEGAIRIGRAVNPSHHHRGFSPNGTLGVFGAAISAGSILKLDADQMADAIGSAAMQASGLEEFCYDGSMSAILNTGHATQAGIISALLAQKGFTGSRGILEGRSGFCRAYSDAFDLSPITEAFGTRFGIADVWFKQYPTCAYCNSTLDIVLDLMREHALSAGDVEEVKVKTFSMVESTVNNPSPENITAAMLSLPYSVAMALHEGRVTQSEFTEEWIENPEVKELMAKVKIVRADEQLLGEGLEKDRGAVVRIACNGGRKFEGRAKAPKGDPLRPLTDEELLAKYTALACQVVDPQVANDIARKVSHLEESGNIRDLMDLLRTS